MKKTIIFMVVNDDEVPDEVLKMQNIECLMVWGKGMIHRWRDEMTKFINTYYG